MKLAIVSDTHLPRGGRSLPAECVERLAAADAILHAGDFVAAEVLERLESLGPPVHAVHGNVDEPALLMRLPAVRLLEAADAILHAGDFMELSVYEALCAIGPPLWGVRGNVDSAELQARLPLSRVVAAEGVRIAMLHDAGPSAGRLARMRRRFPDADTVVFGHSHLPLLESADGFAIFNPGSPTERRRAPVHTMGEALVEDGRVTFSLIELR